jgi:glycerate dehydrogenase
MELAILDSKTLGNDLDLTPLKKFGEVKNYETTSVEETLERIENVEIIITNKVVITKEMMQKASKLKLIAVTATGMNNIDLEGAKELNIHVKNVAGYSTSSVVQHTFTMALYLMGRVNYYNHYVLDGSWSDSNLFTDVSKPFGEIAGKSWGVIGFGTIGKEVAKVATAFGATINYYSTSGQNKINDYHHYELEELLTRCDIISIHAPLNSSTENLLNSKNLSLLKEKAILLNLGRGGIINEADLAKELDSREIYAGLDVISKEPIEKSNPLMQIKNKEQLLITPHIAWASIEARERLLDSIVKNIQNFLENEKLLQDDIN